MRLPGARGAFSWVCRPSGVQPGCLGRRVVSMSNYRGWEQTEHPLCRLPRWLSTLVLRTLPHQYPDLLGGYRTSHLSNSGLALLPGGKCCLMGLFPQEPPNPPAPPPLQGSTPAAYSIHPSPHPYRLQAVQPHNSPSPSIPLAPNMGVLLSQLIHPTL